MSVRARLGALVAAGGLALSGAISAVSPVSAHITGIQAAVAAETAAASPPNVVLVLLDDARYDDLSVMPEVRTQIGDAGASLTHFYSSFPLCCPARATLLSGQYPHNHGVLSNKAPQGGFQEFKDASSLATWLDPTYRTGLIGKYMNQYDPPHTPPGWDEWMVPQKMYNYTASSWWIDQGSNGVYKSLPGYQTNTMGALATDFISRNAVGDQPFFLYTSLVAPHSGSPRTDNPSWYKGLSPYVAYKYRDRFAGQGTGDPSFNEADVSDKPIKPSLLSASEIEKFVEWNAQRRETQLSAQDQVVKIVAALEAAGELDNTYLMFMSDNGFILGEHRIRGGKVAPYEVANRIPFMVRGPGIAPGTRIPDSTAQIDFAPTVLDMAGLPIPDSVDGISLLDKMQDPSTPLGRPGVVIEATNIEATSDPLPWLYSGVVTDHWKYVERTTGKKELYDLDADPHELVNVAGKAAYSTDQARLATMLAKYRWCAGAGCR